MVPPDTAQTSLLTSIWDGGDAELLELMLEFYPARPGGRILDATVNAGRIWKGSTRKVTGLDIDSRHGPTVVGDNRDMPFASESFDVVVYDPPHVPNQGHDVTKDFTSRFGLIENAGADLGYSLSHLYPPFLREAWRVLTPDGVVFAKIADYVHNHRRVWAQRDFVTAAEAAGFTACDYIVKVRKGPIMSPRWKVAHHVRARHVFWLVLRKSRHCEVRRTRT